MPVIAPVPTGSRTGGVDGIPSPRKSAEAAPAAGTTVDHLTETYRAHYRSLLGLAALLLDDTASCEDVVQEAFIRVHSARKRVREPEKTLAYLRQTVVNLSRSALRRRILGLKLLSKPMPDMASAGGGGVRAAGARGPDQGDARTPAASARGARPAYFSDMTERPGRRDARHIPGIGEGVRFAGHRGAARRDGATT
ncbi:SigE family RNA polymerase sigma factor [Streptomyces tanashiensis]